MKRLSGILFALAAMAFTSCYAYLFDWEATPETEVVQIPQEGGVYQFDNFQSEFVGKTRFEPGQTYKHLRYRLILGRVASRMVWYSGWQIGKQTEYGA